MEIKLKLFKQYDVAAFKRDVSFFASETRRHIVTRFQDYCANAMQLMFLHGDSKQIIKAYNAAVLCGYTATFRRVVVPLVPFKHERNDLTFSGKIVQGKLTSLLMLDANGIPAWETLLRKNFDTENQPKVAKDYNAEVSIPTAIKKAVREGTTAATIRRLVNEALKASIVTVKPAKSDTSSVSGSAQKTLITARQKAATA